MIAVFGTLSAIPWILFAQASWDLNAVPAIVAATSEETGDVEVLDRGALFGHGAGRRAREVMRGIDRANRTRIRIETVESLDGAWIADVAHRRAQDAGADRLYVLIAGEEGEVGVVGGRRGPASRLTDQQREHIRRAFLEPLQAGHPDEAFDRGVQAIRATLEDTAADSGTPARAALLFTVTALSVLLVSWVREKVRDGNEPGGEAEGACREHVHDPSWSTYRGTRSSRKVGV